MKNGIYIYKNFHSIKKYWDYIVKSNSEMTIYQTTEWNRCIGFTYIVNHYLIKNFKRRYFVLFRNGIPKIIAPLSLPNDCSDYITLQGLYSKAGVLNLVYMPDTDFSDFDELLQFIFLKAQNKEIRFYETPSFSKFYNYLKQNKKAVYMFGETCVRCKIPDEYETYYNKLSKSARQTIRTSYNRFEKDNLKYTVEFFELNKRIPFSYLPAIDSICKKRENELVNHIIYDNFNVPEISLKLYLSLKRNELYRFITKEDKSICGVLKLNGSIVSVMIALCHNNYLIVPVFAHNSQFDRYSPGVVLLNEFFKKYCGKEFTSLDLSRGHEVYKYRYLCDPEEYRAEHFKIFKV